MSQRNRALGYTRLSRETKGNQSTIQDHIRFILAKAAERGERCDPEQDIYAEDEGLRSGKSLKRRKAMQRLLDRLKWDTSVSSVIFYELERLSRDDEFTQSFIKLTNRLGVELVSISDPGLETKSASGKLVVTIKSAIAEHYSSYVSERLRDYYGRAKRNGWIWHRRAPLGLKLSGSKESRQFAPSDDLPVVIAYLRLAAQGVSLNEAANMLRSQYHARDIRGKPVPLQIFHLREIWYNLELYQPFVPPDLYAEAYRRLAERRGRQMNSRPVRHQSGILRKLLTCGYCGKRWSLASIHDRRHGRDEYWLCYEHTVQYVCDHRRKVARHKLDTQVYALLEAMTDRVLNDPDWLRRAEERWNAKPDDSGPNPAERRAALERKLHNAKRALVEGDIDQADFRAMKAEIEAELKTLELKADTTPPLTLEQVRDRIAEIKDWKQASENTPDLVNLFLRDLLERVDVYDDNRLVFVPRKRMLPLFDGLI